MKKFITILSVAMCAALVGCGFMEKPPTAEELVESAYPDAKSMSADISMEFDMELSGEEVGMDGNFEISMALDATAKSDEDTAILDGKAEIKMFGMTIEQKMKEYSQTSKDLKDVWSYSEENNNWVHTVEPVDSVESSERKIDASIFKDLELKEIEKEGTVYTVTGTVDMKDMQALSNINVDDMASIDGDVDLDGSFDVTLTFDRKTKNLDSIKMELAAPIMSNGAEISSMVIEMKNIAFSDDETALPEIDEEIVEEDEVMEADEVEAYNDSDVSLNEEMDTDVDEVLLEKEDVDSAHAGEEPSEVVAEPEEGMAKVEDAEPKEGMAKIEDAELETDNLEEHGAAPDKICKFYYGSDYVYLEDLEDMYGEIFHHGNTVSNKVVTFVNAYTMDEFLEYTGYWKYMSQDDKTACAYMVELGIVLDSELVSAGADEAELKTLIEDVQSY